jgi:hypothetical protein
LSALYTAVLYNDARFLSSGQIMSEQGRRASTYENARPDQIRTNENTDQGGLARSSLIRSAFSFFPLAAFRVEPIA